MKHLKIGVEFYQNDQPEDVFSSNEVVMTLNGFFLLNITINEMDYNEETLVEAMRATISELISLPPEYLKQTFPRFYTLSLTKQYWYHVFEDGYLKKNPPQKLNTLESIIGSELNISDIIGASYGEAEVKPIDIFFNKDLERIDLPPERPSDDEFWQSILGE